MTAVVAFSIVGAYTIRESLFDIYLMFLFGLLGAFWTAVSSSRP